MSYRLEISPNNRATCSATQCKKEGVKIKKGEIRQAVLVPFQDHQSWKYRHWGCVTPEVLHNWWENAEKNLDLIDGYDTLPFEVQERVKNALEQGHVDDEDWNGDPECNRYTGKKGQGMFVKTPKSKKKKVDEEDEDEASPTKKKAATKKRVRETEDEKSEETPLANAPPAKKSKPKKAKDADADEVEPKATPKPKPKKTKRSDADETEMKPAPKKDRKPKVLAEPTASSETKAEKTKTALQKRKTTRSKKAAAEDDV
ncbi:hypothetical protein M433DRAFT_152997 [Acidomyces richmondensis BFW]|nr:MAG: hypothetical protein FE78DRAFT_88637 [Acidomyces sp. 'richmondensis']KYG46751.1 hypothetical protein M433DRAFT_152997 [Acidomyces richmondensis BFW]